MSFNFRIVFIFCVIIITSCSQKERDTYNATVVYESDVLTITQISDNAYVHTSYLQTESFGKVGCNGLLVYDHGETIIFDTPTTDSVSSLLMYWIETSLHSNVKAVIATHFHEDCLGGLNAFHQHSVASYANQHTIALAHENDLELPEHAFHDSLSLAVGETSVMVRYFGEGHTRDNVVGYFPKEHILFGGCLIKAQDATKGFLGDANVDAWPITVEKVKKAFPHVEVVIPGHGAIGDASLLDYTIKLFR
jgi:metallo-beta-lactamase class B